MYKVQSLVTIEIPGPSPPPLEFRTQHSVEIVRLYTQKHKIEKHNLKRQTLAFDETIYYKLTTL